VDDEVQAALREMVIATRDEMKAVSETSVAYDPSEKHAGKENLYLRLDSDMAANIRAIHEANNLPIDPTALSDPSHVFCYFAHMRDTKGRRLTAIRRATAFKGVPQEPLCSIAQRRAQTRYRKNLQT
jgi:hypothetical protein